MEEEYFDKKLPFAELMHHLFEDEALSIPLLYQLSDLETADLAAFQARWPQAADERRQQIARHLADLTEDSFTVDFAPLLAILLSDAIPAVRVAALDGLWDATDVKLVAPILRLLEEDGETAVRASAASTLAHYVLMSEWGELPPSVSTRIVPRLLAQYEAVGTETAVKRAALEAMAAANHPRVPQFIEEAYEDKAFEMQLSAVFSFFSSADLRWLQTVLYELESPMAEMRAEAARAAGVLGSSDAVPGLAELTLDEDSDVVEAAIIALGQIGGEEPTRILTELLDDAEAESFYEVIEEALEAMSWLAGDFTLFDFDEDEADDEDDLGLFSQN